MPKLSIRKIHILLFLIIVFLPDVSLRAQSLAQNENKNGVIYGKIVDENSAVAVKDASIQLLHAAKSNTSETVKKEILLASQLSNKIGEFYFDNLPNDGTFLLKISIEGYKPQSIPITFTAREKTKNNDNSPVKALGTIKLEKDLVVLENIDIVGQKELISFAADKKIYSVEKDILAAGGTILEIIKNLPGIFVQYDGNIVLRNEAPLIYIDGRPTTLTLDQIPADQVFEIEVITNPSSKYSGSGATGILNIILKRNKKIGFWGNLRTQIDNRGRPGFAADFNLKKGKINFFAAGNVFYRKIKNNFITNRWDTFPSGNAYNLQKNNPINNSVYLFGKTGFDYKINNKNTLSLFTTVTKGIFDVKDKIHTNADSNFFTNTTKEYTLRKLAVDAGYLSIGAEATYFHVFANPQKELSIDLQYQYNENDNNSKYNSQRFDANNVPKPQYGALEATGGGHSNIVDFHTNFTSNFKNHQKIEFGIRANVKDYFNWNDNYLEDIITNNQQLLPQISIRYTYQEQLFAGYADYSKEYKKLNYNVALRVENASANGDFRSRNLKISNNFPVSFFPSASIGYAISETQSIQMSYSRKIFRPGMTYLAPFVDFSDSLNLSVGNPTLKPEYAQTAEINFNYHPSSNRFVLLSVYGKHADQIITRYQYIDANINPLKPARYFTYGNGKRAYTLGVEMIYKESIASFWDITSNLNVFYNHLNTSNLVANAISNKTSYSIKLLNQIYLPKNISIQFSGDYQSSSIIPGSGNKSGNIAAGQTTLTYAQGILASNYGLDIGVKANFWKKKSGSLTLQFSDILRRRVYTIKSYGKDFSLNSSRRRDPQYIRLTFNYRFGKHDAGLFKRKEHKNDIESLQNIQATP